MKTEWVKNENKGFVNFIKQTRETDVGKTHNGTAY